MIPPLESIDFCSASQIWSQLFSYSLLFCYQIYCVNDFVVTTSGNRTPGSRFYSDLLDALADSVCIHQLVLKRRSKQLVCSCNCRQLTYGSFQLTHMSHDDHTVQLIQFERAMAAKNGDKTLLQHSQHCHKGEFRHVNISARKQSLRCRHNLCRAFLRATLAMTVGSCARVMSATWRQKGS